MPGWASTVLPIYFLGGVQLIGDRAAAQRLVERGELHGEPPAHHAPRRDQLLLRGAGRALPALKSRQLEAGLKHARNGTSVALAAFAITRPHTGDAGACDGYPARDWLPDSRR